ncbi:MAG: hypothetical protein A2Y60_07455 [Chloroflexi bacterium RBG_13_54_9]|nr:MAG: hypothetical protein A2Y60_07455 [Chloroflexi bacterium RBG_13_54_9]
MYDKEGLDETTADAILLASFKGSKKKPTDLLTIARATRFKIGQWKSIRRVAEAFDVSTQQVREFNSLLDLPPDVQKLFEGHRTGVSKWYELSKLSDPQRQSELGRFVVDLGAIDTRAVVDYARSHPETPVDECVQRVLESKTVKEDIHVIVIPLSQAVYRDLHEESRKSNTSLEQLASSFIEEGLKQRQLQQ